MRAIVPFQVPAVTSAALARLNDALTVVPDRSVAATPATAIEPKKASR